MIQQLVNGMRTLDPGSKESAPSWKFCVDRLDVRLNGPIKEYVQVYDAPELTDEEYAAEVALIAQEYASKLTPEERERLVKQPTITQGVGTDSIQ